MKYNIVPPLPKTAYTRAAQARRAVAIAVEYALIHEKGDPQTPRALRAYFDMLFAKKEAYVDVKDGFILPPDYGPAMNLRREMDLMARYGRLYPSATAVIGGFMQQIPGLIQYLDPDVPDPKYTIVTTIEGEPKLNASGHYTGRCQTRTYIDGVEATGIAVRRHYRDPFDGRVRDYHNTAPINSTILNLASVAAHHTTHGGDMRTAWESPGGWVYTPWDHFVGFEEVVPPAPKET